MKNSRIDSSIKIVKIPNGKRSVVFDLIKLQRDGKLKSQLIEFDNGSGVRVYWDSKYSGKPKQQKVKKQ